MSKMIENGMWIMGNGKSIRAWEENWFGAEFFLNKYIVTIPDELHGLTCVIYLPIRGIGIFLSWKSGFQRNGLKGYKSMCPRSWGITLTFPVLQVQAITISR